MAIAAAVARRPALWPAAIGQARRLAAVGWWRRPPFVPLPPSGYLRFRLLTQYGDDAARPVAADVVSYLRWCRGWRRTAGHW